MNLATYKKHAKRLILSFSLILPVMILRAQTYVPSGQMTGTPAAGSYYNNTSIVLKPGFSFAAAAGSSLSLYITTCVPQTTNLSADKNYILTSVPRVAGIKTPGDMANRGVCDMVQSVQYFDGLGRTLQEITISGSVTQKDIVSPFGYDPTGLQAIKYLPYTTSNGVHGSYRANALTGNNGYSNSEQRNFYQAVDQNYTNMASPFATTNFEASPLGRPTEQGKVGDNWQPGGGHTVKFDYQLNNEVLFSSDPLNSRRVALFAVDQAHNLVRQGNNAVYAAGTLSVNVVKNENWTTGRAYTTEEFKNKFGQIILSRSFTIRSGQLVQLSTYYVYDDYGSLCFVLPPKADPDNTFPVAGTLNDLCYQYRYDKRQRLLSKKVAGSDWEYFVYNKSNQLVLSQNGRQRINGVWVFIKYDGQNRPAYTGEISSTASQSTLQADLDNFWGPASETFTNSTTNHGYTSVSYPLTFTKVLTVNYYDNYDFLTNSTINPSVSVFTSPPAAVDSLLKQPQGMLTATKTNILESANYLFTLNYYDTHNREVKTISNIYKNGSLSAGNYGSQELQYAFTGALVKNKKVLVTGSSTLSIQNTYAYDIAGRLLTVKESYNGAQPITLAAYEYNELGQMIAKHQGSKSADLLPDVQTYFQHFRYKYNQLGQLSQVNDPDNIVNGYGNKPDIFGLKIHYNDAFASAVPKFDGNISALEWQTRLPLSATISQEKKSYVYNYDDLNQLVTATFASSSGTGSNKFNEEAVYDLGGNITRLKRKNSITLNQYLNDLTYNYGTGTITGNKLLNISDTGTEGYNSTYTYDADGSIKTDSKKGLSGAGNGVTYNSLGLPSHVQFSSGKVIDYTYAADAALLRRVVKINSAIQEARDYLGGIEFTDSNGLEFIANEEGRALPNASAFINEYNVTDHLGNVRAYYGDKNSNGILDDGDVIQNVDYYPFGREINYGAAMPTLPSNQYKFSGKELQADLEQLDFGARFYDPIVARWNVIDPLADHYVGISPYQYALNNPGNKIDPSGMGAFDWYLPLGIQDVGQAVWFEGSKDIQGYQRLGAEGYGYDEQSLQTVHFLSDGTRQEYTPGTPDFTITATRIGPSAGEKALDLATDFVPLVGPGKDIYRGIRDGNYWQAGAGILFMAMDVATLGEASLAKGAVKTAIKESAEVIARDGAELAAKREAKVGAEQGFSAVRDYSTKQTKNYSAYYRSEREARNVARTKVGANPVLVEPNKLRSLDGKWQYRAKAGDLLENHIHIEELNPLTGEVLQNFHLRW